MIDSPGGGGDFRRYGSNASRDDDIRASPHTAIFIRPPWLSDSLVFAHPPVQAPLRHVHWVHSDVFDARRRGARRSGDMRAKAQCDGLFTCDLKLRLYLLDNVAAGRPKPLVVEYFCGKEA